MEKTSDIKKIILIFFKHNEIEKGCKKYRYRLFKKKSDRHFFWNDLFVVCSGQTGYRIFINVNNIFCLYLQAFSVMVNSNLSACE